MSPLSSPPSIRNENTPESVTILALRHISVFSQDVNYHLRGVLMSVDIAPVLLRKVSFSPLFWVI